MVAAGRFVAIAGMYQSASVGIWLSTADQDDPVDRICDAGRAERDLVDQLAVMFGLNFAFERRDAGMHRHRELIVFPAAGVGDALVEGFLDPVVFHRLLGPLPETGLVRLAIDHRFVGNFDARLVFVVELDAIGFVLFRNDFFIGIRPAVGNVRSL